MDAAVAVAVVGRSGVASLCVTLKPRLRPAGFEPTGVNDLEVRNVRSAAAGTGPGDCPSPSPRRTSASTARSKLPFTPLRIVAFR